MGDHGSYLCTFLSKIVLIYGGGEALKSVVRTFLSKALYYGGRGVMSICTYLFVRNI